jgi:hypothetical protein
MHPVTKVFAPLFTKSGPPEATMIKKTRLMIDGHIHIYECYDLEIFFKTATAYLDHFYNTLYANGSPYEKVLLLTEGKSVDFFAHLKANREIAGEAGFHIMDTGEDTSLILAKDRQPQCYILRGRQIVTRENLEVLAIASSLILEDGLPIETVIETVIGRHDLAVLAWGFGKWLFQRAKIIGRMLDMFRSPYLLVGDNSGRPVFWPTPRLFQQARAMNIPVISGSDPLPFKGEVNKPGSFGFTIEGEFDPRQPGRSLKELLTAPGVYDEIDRFGYRDGIISFFNRQSKIHMKKYL